MTADVKPGVDVPLATLADIVAACAGQDPIALFGAVDHFARSTLGHTLCTVNRYDPKRIAVIRLYSSNPTAYPPGGSKDKAGTAWGKTVLLKRQVFVGEGVAAIRESFDDHEAIQALGLQSVINIPVVANDVCLGTVNFLMPRQSVQAAHVQFAQLAGLLCIPAFLALLANIQPPSSA